MVEKITLKEMYDFSEYIKDFEVINYSISFDRNLCILACRKNYYNTLKSYKIIILNENTSIEIELENTIKVFHYVQKLPNQEIILVNARSFNYENNSSIYDYYGVLKREFNLGDSIEEIGVNKSGEIWVSYFDQSLEWRMNDIDSSGLRCFDSSGNKIYSYNIRFIFDCYSMNLVSNNEIWFYYYTDFNIVRLTNKNETGCWKSPIKGFHKFAIWKKSILSSGSYDDSNFHLFEISELGNLEEKCLIQFFNEEDIFLNDKISCSRGELIYFFYMSKCYIFNLRDLF